MIISGTRLTGGTYKTLGLVTNNLTMWLDANNPASYPGSGATWSDLSGNGADQTFVGAPVYTAGAASYFTFNGFTQYSVGSTPFVLPPSQYTKMVWFQFNTTGADNNLVSSASGGHFMYGAGTSTLWAGNANNPPFSGPGAFGTASSLSSNTWYCAAVVFSSPQISIYLNGVLNDFDATYGPAHSGDGSTNLACFGPAGNLLNGKIAEVYCYAAALTAGEVLQNYNATKSRYGL